MSRGKQPTVAEFSPAHGSLMSYTTGFVASIMLTLGSYFVATSHGTGRMMALIIIGLLAAVQCALQLRLFLHLGEELKPRYKLLTFSFVLLTLIIVIGGSIWIMDNLNYRMMYSPRDLNTYVKGQDGL